MTRSYGPLDTPRRLLMGSGPTNAEPRVLRALAAPPLPADDPFQCDLANEVASLQRAVFQAGADATSVAVSGASRAGLEAAIVSLVEPGDRVLVGVYGHFGELLCALATRHGGRVERVDAAWGEAIPVERMVAQIERQQPKLVAIVHADTSTGILQPLRALGAACRTNGSLLLVDCVLSLGGCEVAADAWGLDVAVGGLQKCLGAPPGLALVTWSARAQAALLSRQTPIQSVYLDLKRTAIEGQASSTMLLGAREALRIVLEEGLRARWARHLAASQALRAGLRAMGLELFVTSEHAVPMITLVRVPGGIDEAAVRGQLLEQHGVEIMAAFGPLRGRVWRIGAMATNACPPSVLAVLGALEAVLASRGFRLARGAAVDAALRGFAHAAQPTTPATRPARN